MEGRGASLTGKDINDFWRGSHRSLHIFHLDMLAVMLVLQQFKLEIQSRTVLLFVATSYPWCVICGRRQDLDLEISAFFRGLFSRSIGLGRLAGLSDTFCHVSM